MASRTEYPECMTYGTTPTSLGKTKSGQVQGALFSPALLPRKVPTFRHGPEDEPTLH